jgi:hypothetical protein
MATTYTVVLFSRQHVGNAPGLFDGAEPDVVFAGPVKEVPFDCPGVDPAETALLLFQSRDVDHRRNVLRVNGVDVFGGLPVSPARNAWNGNILLIEPHHQLRASGNVLRVEARTSDGGSAGDVDDFVLDNAVLMYKSLGAAPPLPSATGDLATFLTAELLPSIANVRGSGAGANAADQRNEYVLPTPAQLEAWRAVFRSLVDRAWDRAHAQAKAISTTYNVVRFVDTPSSRTHYILMEGIPGQIPAPAAHASGEAIVDPADPTRRGWGTYVFAAQPQRALGFSAPHLKDDLETEHQAVEAYLAARARTLLIAGTDRDQNTADAPCAQSQRPYKQSDVSHTADCVFQIAFEEIYASDASTWHVQFHGNAICADDVFLSNGVANPPARLRALADSIETASAAAAAGGRVITVGVFDAGGGCTARGTDNMQMRFASGVAHASICREESVPIGPSRFIHVEQRRTVRRAASDPEATPGVNRDILLQGMLATFTGPS